MNDSDPLGARTKMAATNRSVRVEDWLWAAAKRRAEHDNVNISTAVIRLLHGYVDGVFNLPTVKFVYDNTDQ